MYTLFEPGDLLNSPYEALLFDTAKHSFPIRAHWHHYMEIILMVEGTAIVESDEKNTVCMLAIWQRFHPSAFMPFTARLAAQNI